MGSHIQHQDRITNERKHFEVPVWLICFAAVCLTVFAVLFMKVTAEDKFHVGKELIHVTQ